jgi:hypothetical protein
MLQLKVEPLTGRGMESHRSVAKRSGPLCRTADRGGDRRNARSCDRRHRAARAALRDRIGADRSRRERELRAGGRRSRLSGGSASRRRRGRAGHGDQADHCHLRDRGAISQSMEPHAIVAAWEGDTLSIDTPSQGLAGAQARLAAMLDLSPEAIHIRSPFLGGGFGCKGFISGPQILGVIAARITGRPIKLVLRREQMFGPDRTRAVTESTCRSYRSAPDIAPSTRVRCWDRSPRSAQR